MHRLSWGQQAWIALLLLIAAITPAQAGVIGIIIDDIGYSYRSGQRAAALHPAITLSVLPEAPYAKRLSSELNTAGHELMLHLPMQAGFTKAATEPVVLREDMEESLFKTIIEDYLGEFPEVRGINNHMGSLLTQRADQMTWLMQVLSARSSLYFVDSRTHRKTIAAKVATEFEVTNTHRDIFLDHGTGAEDQEVVWRQIQRLQQRATRKGFALAIGHPHSSTLAVLQRALPWLESRGHTIVPISRYIKLKEERQCPECLSPLPKVVKNSKP